MDKYSVITVSAGNIVKMKEYFLHKMKFEKIFVRRNKLPIILDKRMSMRKHKNRGESVISGDELRRSLV